MDLLWKHSCKMCGNPISVVYVCESKEHFHRCIRRIMTDPFDASPNDAWYKRTPEGKVMRVCRACYNFKPVSTKMLFEREVLGRRLQNKQHSRTLKELIDWGKYDPATLGNLAITDVIRPRVLYAGIELEDWMALEISQAVMILQAS